MICKMETIETALIETNRTNIVFKFVRKQNISLDYLFYFYQLTIVWVLIGAEQNSFYTGSGKFVNGFLILKLLEDITSWRKN